MEEKSVDSVDKTVNNLERQGEEGVEEIELIRRIISRHFVHKMRKAQLEKAGIVHILVDKMKLPVFLRGLDKIKKAFTKKPALQIDTRDPWFMGKPLRFFPSGLDKTWYLQ